MDIKITPDSSLEELQMYLKHKAETSGLDRLTVEEGTALSEILAKSAEIEMAGWKPTH